MVYRIAGRAALRMFREESEKGLWLEDLDEWPRCGLVDDAEYVGM
jgi:hypothetical protein